MARGAAAMNAAVSIIAATAPMGSAAGRATALTAPRYWSDITASAAHHSSEVRHQPGEGERSFVFGSHQKANDRDTAALARRSIAAVRAWT
jgi:hypothetical protein